MKYTNWRYDIQHNDTQHDDTQHNDTQQKGLNLGHSALMTLSILCSDCHYGECRNLLNVMLNVFMFSVVMLSVVAPTNLHKLYLKMLF